MIPVNRDGHFDIISGFSVQGWALGPSDDRPAAIEIEIDGRRFGHGVADHFREDLKQAGIRDGYAHFVFEIPASFFDNKEHHVDVFNSATGKRLHNSPQRFCFQPAILPIVVEKSHWLREHVALAADSRFEAMRLAIIQSGKLALFSTYHQLNRFLDYHRQTAESLVESGFTVVIVHAADVFSEELREIETDSIFVLSKRNIGYDFGSWAFGVLYLIEHTRDLSELLLINDSIIGPFCEINTLFEDIRSRNADFVGLTDSYERRYHVQSYFMWFGKAVCSSGALALFCAEYPFTSDKELVIAKGELLLTKQLTDRGFTIDVLFPYQVVAGRWLSRVESLITEIRELPNLTDSGEANGSSQAVYKVRMLERLDWVIGLVVSGNAVNPTHFFWDTLIDEFQFPFIKRELALSNPALVPSYFRISSVLERRAPGVAKHIIQVRQRYGGNIVPPLDL